MVPEVAFPARAARAARRLASMVRSRLRPGGRYGAGFYRRQKEASRASARVVLPMFLDRVYDVIRARVWADPGVQRWDRENLLVLANVEDGEVRRSMEQAAGRWACPSADVVHPAYLAANANRGSLGPTAV